jgi:hypothetical protein
MHWAKCTISFPTKRLFTCCTWKNRKPECLADPRQRLTRLVQYAHLTWCQIVAIICFSTLLTSCVPQEVFQLKWSRSRIQEMHSGDVRLFVIISGRGASEWHHKESPSVSLSLWLSCALGGAPGIQPGRFSADHTWTAGLHKRNRARGSHGWTTHVERLQGNSLMISSNVWQQASYNCVLDTWRY